MVDKVTFEETTYNELPFKFEAGTMNYAGAIGMGAALDYVSGLEEMISLSAKRCFSIMQAKGLQQ